jgi:hypothetical protein
MAGILIDSLFADRLTPAIMQNLREAMHKATRGNIPRCQDWFGDDMCASYSNVSTTPVLVLSLTVSLSSCDVHVRHMWAK